ncbi:hypothetical protein Tco_0520091 [Tanacetum coccineum]
MENGNLPCTLGDYSRPSHEGYRNTAELPDGNNVVPLRSNTIRLVQNGSSFHELWSEDPKQHLKDFLKTVDSLDLNVENRERTRLLLFQFSLRDQASNWLERLPLLKANHRSIGRCPMLMDARLAPKPFVQVNKIASSCEICSGPHDTQYCMENPEKAFVGYASSHTDEAGGLVSNFMASQDARLSKFEADFKQQQSEMSNKIDTFLKAINWIIRDEQ